MRPFIKVALPLATVSAAALLLHRRAGSLGRPVAGGVLIGHAAAYDRLTGWLLGPRRRRRAHQFSTSAAARATSPAGSRHSVSMSPASISTRP
jgi:hypothetical protein